MEEKEKWEILILDPKVKGLLQELQHLQLIDILYNDNKSLKQSYLDKFQGKNLLDIDSSEITIK